MHTLTALSRIIDNVGLNMSSLSRSLGKGKNYINNYYVKGIMPRVDTFAAIVGACGYDLIVRSRSSGEELLITQEDDGADG